MKKKKGELVNRRARRKKVILVPIDFSDSSVRALRHSVDLVQESGGALVPALRGSGGLRFARDRARRVLRA